MSSKPDDPASTQAAANEAIAESKSTNVESDQEDEDEHDPEPVSSGSIAQASAKKKKSKKKRIKAALGVGGGDAAEGGKDGKEGIEKALQGLSKAQVQELLKLNPGLAAQLKDNDSGADMSGKSMAEQLKRLKVRILSI